jgi:hypothetical protein
MPKIKKRNWACIVYPDSAPDNWHDILQQSGLQCAISPLHLDLNPDDTEKKPHWHVIMCYSGPTSYNVVKALTDKLHGAAPNALEQIKGYYRYLTHKDNPEKKQYDERDIICINGFNISDFVEMTKSEVNEIKRKLQTYIRENDILEYSVLLDYLLDNEMFLEHDVASSNTILFHRYITSRRHHLCEIKTSPKT